ncbi:hypothetical protein LRP30_31345 [Bradyrhizobium sp. C-145]|uniref:hypothetical protein n=1 Tax=Bradyrhizobium sp. C-145 TaxID=574727 RepID=UPI00201B8D41|nr:hypothetical protein [Bradyrhizobium sp. C-145]UQR61398.1 hypothetical protein LRP30_31345 [Bradyrhizobium sp. C-145]
MGLIDVEQQRGRELLRTAWSRITNPRHACIEATWHVLSSAKTLAGLRFGCSPLDVGRTPGMSDEQGSVETILKESHLETYRPLVMLCLGSQETRSPPVAAVQIGNLRI